MANTGEVVTRLTFYDIDDNEIEYDREKFSKFNEAFIKFSFRDNGHMCHDEYPMYYLFTRWAFGGNFGWKTEIDAIAKELKDLGVTKVEGVFTEWELGMDFCNGGMFMINDEGVHQVDSDYSYTVKEYLETEVVKEPITLEQWEENMGKYCDLLYDHVVESLVG